MGNAAIWWYPDGTGTVEKIDLGRPLTDRQGPFVVVRHATSESYTGANTTIRHSARARVRILLDNFTDRGVRRKLVAVVNHLQDGGSIMMAEDDANAVASFLTIRPVRGSTVLYRGKNLFRELVSSTTLMNTEVILQGPQPDYRLEMRACSAYAAGSATVDAGLSLDWSDQRWVLLRHVGAYPALRLPKESINGEFLKHVYENRFVLDLPLEEIPGALENLAGADGAVFGAEDGQGGIRQEDLTAVVDASGATTKASSTWYRII